MTRTLLFLVACAVASTALTTRPARAQHADPTFPIVLGRVFSSAIRGGTLYVGGQFQFVGPNTGSFACTDAASGSGLPSARIDGTVHAIAPGPAGGWYVAGDFDSVSGVPRANLALIHDDGSLAAWNPGADAPVRALVVVGSHVYAGGEFLNAGGQARRHVAELEAASGAATTWDADADSVVYALACDGGVLWLGGRFDHVGGQPRAKLATVDAASGAVLPWSTTIVTSPGGFPYVSTLAVDDSAVYAAGGFTGIGGQARQNLAALDPVTGLASAWYPVGAGGALVRSIAPLAGTVLLGGSFSNMGGQPRANLAEVLATTGAATAWNPGTDGAVKTIVVSSGRALVCGAFTAAGGALRSGAAAIDLATGVADAWDPAVQGNPLALGVSAGDTTRLAIGGDAMSVGAVARSGLAAIDLASGAITGWNPNVGGFVRSLSIVGSTVYVGGGFSSIGGAPRTNLAAVDLASGSPLAWNPGAADGSIETLFARGGTVYVGGGFTHVGVTPRDHLAAIDATTGALTAWNPGADNWVEAVAERNGRVYVGGSFYVLAGQAQQRFAAVDSATGASLGWHVATDNTVSCLVPGDDGYLYVGGWFTSVGADARARIARVDATTGVLDGWNPGAAAPVDAIVPDGPVVWAGGFFTQLGGGPAHAAGALDAVTAAALPWDPELYYAAWTMAVTNDLVFAGGDLWRSGSLPIQGLAKLLPADATPPAPQVISPNGGERLWDGEPSFQVVWTTDDDQPVRWVDLEISLSGPGGPWSPLATALPNTGSYDWRAPQAFLAGSARAQGATPCYLRVVARDLAGNVGSDASDAAFYLTSPGSVLEPPLRLSLRVAASPLRGAGKVTLVLPRGERVRATVFDVHGREVVRLADGELPAGSRTFELPAALAPGVYVVQAVVGPSRLARKFVVLD